MTNPKIAHVIWDQVLDACKGLPVDEARLARFLGQYVAWHLLPVTFRSFPKALHAPEIGSTITGKEIDAAWKQLAACPEIGDARYAFSTDPRDVHQYIAESTLSKLNDFMWGLMLLGEDQRDALGVKIVEACLTAFLIVERDIPLEVAEFMVRLVSPKKQQSIFCPGPMPNSLAVVAMRDGARPRIVSETPPVPACLFAAITGAKLDVVIENPYRNRAFATKSEPDHQDEIGTICPPFGKLIDRSGQQDIYLSEFGVRSFEALGVEIALRRVQKRAAVLVPNGFLFSSGADQKLRRHLVETGRVAKVISFPAGLLSYANIPFSVLLIQPSTPVRKVSFCKVDEKRHISGHGKLRAHERRFIGAEDVFQLLDEPDGQNGIHVDLRQIQEQDHFLTVDRYLSAPADLLKHLSHQSEPLGDLVEIIKPRFLPTDESPDAVEIQEATPGEMPKYGYLTHVVRTRRVDPHALRSNNQHRLQQGDVLLSTKGTIGTVAIADPDKKHDGGLYPSQASMIFRLTDRSRINDPRFLLMYMRSPAVQNALEALASGGTIPNITLSDLRSFPVWVPPIEVQEKFIKAFDEQADIQAEIEKLHRVQTKVVENLWRRTELLGSPDEPGAH